jgi:hypothetical protein
VPPEAHFSYSGWISSSVLVLSFRSAKAGSFGEFGRFTPNFLVMPERRHLKAG